MISELNRVIDEWNEVQPKDELKLCLWGVLDGINDPSDEREIQETIDFIQSAINDYLNI